MTIKLVVREYTLNVVSAYAPHAGRNEEVKRHFWEGLDEIVRHVPPAEKLHGHIGLISGGYGGVHRGFSSGERNRGGTSLLDFAKVFRLVIANSSFPKREEHLVTFQNVMAKSQIDYLLLRRSRLCKDCKKLLNEEGERDIALGKLEHSESHRDSRYCRRIKVEEFVRAMHKMSRGRAIGPDEISVEF
uniref:Craniofacial development protein 2-like n=1 Tax=Nicotiana tabacum TaxID=4097 RepID=A0A1S3XF41_TOBAC|nr:PREDICTED: uncharacterized protein LOC107764432 [Nicotiana tabacum]